MSATTTTASRAQVFRRLHPHAYLDRFLSEGFRPDGRTPEEWRDVFVNVGSISTADGSSLVKMGGTTVVCGVKAELAEPELDTPDQGFLVPNVDLAAICSPKFKPGPPSEEAQALSERLNAALVSAQILPLSTLCIAPGRSAWCLYVDAICVNFDGNTFDAALLAIVAALRNTTLPQVSHSDVTGRTTSRSPSDRRPLALSGDRTVLACSFGVVATPSIPHHSGDQTGLNTSGPILLADPTAFEEPLLARVFSVLVNARGQVINVEDAACGEPGQEEGHDFMEECIQKAQERAKKLCPLVE